MVDNSRASGSHMARVDSAPEARGSIATYQREISRQRETEVRLREALARGEAQLRQKDDSLLYQQVLSREADHRLLNGLQIIFSLLSLQSRSETNADAAAHLAVAASRVAAVARIHRRLHSIDGETSVAFKSFLRELCDDYAAMLVSDGHRSPAIVVEGCDADLPAAIAIPLSLVVNELITNAAKHGRGTIMVRLEEPTGGGHLLSVCNDGPELPPDFDPAASTGLGMKIVQALVTQIAGTLEIDRCAQCDGTRFAVSFP